ncbi:MAG: PqqD family protein [bacterium]|nr:PqqD family protein [bacterium]
MSQHTSFRVNTPSVISEIVDNEAIIVNLDNGAYYSLRDTGCVIWRLIEQGATTAQIVAQLNLKYGGATAVIMSAVQQLITELRAEALVSPAMGGNHPTISVVYRRRQPPRVF